MKALQTVLSLRLAFDIRPFSIIDVNSSPSVWLSGARPSFTLIRFISRNHIGGIMVQIYRKKQGENLREDKSKQ